ncbi:hypothetical protein D0463_11825, partial [Bacillus sp. V59.32b]
MLQRINQAAQQAQQSVRQIQQRAQQMSGMGMQAGGFAGAQNIMQPGFAGTDGQQVRQEIAQDLQNQSGMNSGSMGGYQQFAGAGFGGGQSNMQSGFGGAQNIMQPGFAGTDGQQVRQEIARDLQNQSG